jgi:hypothetical protein
VADSITAGSRAGIVCVRSLADALRILKQQAARRPAPQWVRVCLDISVTVLKGILIEGSVERKVLFVSF